MALNRNLKTGAPGAHPAPGAVADAPKDAPAPETLVQGATDAAPASESAAEGAPVDDLGADLPGSPEGAEAPKGEKRSDLPSKKVLDAKEKGIWTSDVAKAVLYEPFGHREAENSAYHNCIKPRGVKDASMKEAISAGTMVMNSVLNRASFIPQGRTVAQDLEALDKSIGRHADFAKKAVESQVAFYKENQAGLSAEDVEAKVGRAQKGHEHTVTALETIAAAGKMAAEQGNQVAVRMLNGLLQGLSSVGMIAKTMREEAKDQKENYPKFRPASINGTIQGIKDPAKLVEVATKWANVEVKEKHTAKQEWEKTEPSASVAKARATAEKAARMCFMVAIPTDAEATKKFMDALGKTKASHEQRYERQKQAAREQATPGAENKAKDATLKPEQQEAVNEFKAFLEENAAHVPTYSDGFKAMLADGVEVAGKEEGSTEVFKIEKAENQDLFHQHLTALNGQDQEKAKSAEIYFGRMWKSRELAYAIVESQLPAAE